MRTRGKLQFDAKWVEQFIYVPFCFMGMGVFRVWTETLYANGSIEFFAQVSPFWLAKAGLDAYFLFDMVAAGVLVALAALARRIAPLHKRTGVVLLTAFSMIASACFNFASVVIPSLGDLFFFPAIICGGVGIALILMLWSEFFGCINPLRVALYYSASIVVSALILWVFKGLLFPWIWVGTCVIPIVSLLCLWRSYARLPNDAYPPVYQADYSFPWKPVLLVGIYSFVYGLRSGIFSSFLAMNSGLGAFCGALFVYLLVCLRRENLDFSLMWKIAVPLMLMSLVPLDQVFPGWMMVADFCALASYTILLIFIMVILSNLSYRFGICALWLFSIERAVRLISAQIGRLAGGALSSLDPYSFVHLAIVSIMAILLVSLAAFFFSEKRLSSPWGVVLVQPISEDRELYLEKNRLGMKVREIARTFSLTSREEEILLMISQRRSVSEIASNLFIGKNTVKTHVRHVYQKLDVHSRAEVFELLGME